MADGYISQIKTPDNKVYLLKDSEKTDEKVNQTSNTEDKEFPIILKNTDNTTNETNGVKYDGDVTVNPSKSKITATTIQANSRLVASKAISQIITGTGTAGSYTNNTYHPAKWTFNTGLTATDGDIFTIKIPVAGHDYGVFMSVDNGSHYYPVVLNGTERITTHYPINTYITVIFEPTGSAASMYALAGQTSSTRTTVTGGVWRVLNYRDTNSNDIGYYHRRIYPNLKAGGAIHPYSIIMQLPNGRWSGITTTAPNNPGKGKVSPVATGKTANASGFMLGHVLLMYANTTYADANNIGTYNIWSAYTGLIDARYSFNLANSTGNGFVAYTPVYIVGTVSDGLFYLDATKWWTQTLPSSDDGKVYIYIGDAYDWYRLTFTEDKPMYWYKDGAIRLYSGASEYALSAPLSGISDADDLKAIEAISGTSGLLKKTAANTWTLDTNTYLTAHRTYTTFTGKPTENQAPGFGDTFTIQQINQNTTGQVSGTDRTVTIPSLPTTATRWPAWGEVTGKPSTFAPSAHTHYELATIGDKRNEDTTPDTYKNRIIFQGLKKNSTINSPYTDTFSYLIGLRGWRDSSGGDSHELAFNGNGIYRRQGATTDWENWLHLLDSGNTTTGVNNTATLAWSTTYTIAKINDVDIKFTTMAKPSYAFTDLTEHPTTLSGYGITDAASSSHSHTLKIGNKSLSVSTSEQEWDVHDILYNSDHNIGTNTSWDITEPGVYSVASSGAFTGEQHPSSNGNQSAPYTYGHAFTIRANNGGASQFYINHNASESKHSSRGIRYRSGWNVINNPDANHWRPWATILDDKNFNLYAPTLTGTGASGSWGISITGTAAKATADASGNTITTTYAPLASPALTGTPTAPTAANGTNTTQIATTAFVNNTLSYANAMRFKGTLGTGGTITALPASHEAGDTYRVITAGTWAGQYCEEGTLIICVKDGAVASNDDWTSVETNEDGAVIGPSSSIGNNITTFSGNTGRIIQDSGKAFSTAAPESSSTDTQIPTAKAVWAAINALDADLNSTTPGAGKTLTAFSQTDGKVSATFGDISITESQISDLKSYLQLSGGIMTGNICRYYDAASSEPMITALANNVDIYLFQLGHGTVAQTNLPNNGYKLLYKGTNSSTNNYLQLIATKPDGTEIIATQVDEIGNIALNATTASTSTTSGALTVAGGLGVAGQVTATRLAANGSNTSYNLYVNGTSYLNGNTIINGNLIPGANNTKTLGSTSARWSKLYIGTADTHGDAYTPIYWNDGVPTEVTLVQQCAFTIKSGKSGVRLSHAAITANSYVTEIVITSGESKLNSAISWTSAAGYIELTCSSTVSGDVTGYIMVSRGGEITATATDIA